MLVHTKAPEREYVDAVTDAGLQALGLPATHPWDSSGEILEHRVCQSIGERAWDAGEHGIACRSAARSAPPAGEELAFFAREGLREERTERFLAWYW